MVDVRDTPHYRIVTAANPAAGANLSITVPGGQIWVPHTLVFRLVTDANVATRVVNLTVSDGTNIYARVGAVASQAASLTRDYTVQRGIGLGAPPGTLITIIASSAPVPLESGHVLATAIENIQVGDQISAVAAKVLVYPTGPRVTPIPEVDTIFQPRNGLEAGVPPLYGP